MPAGPPCVASVVYQLPMLFQRCLHRVIVGTAASFRGRLSQPFCGILQNAHLSFENID